MLRRILAIVLGLILGSTVLSLAHGLLSLIKPLPPGLDYNDIEAVKAFIKTLSFTELHLSSLGHALGALTAGYVASWFSKERRFSAGILAMLIFTGMTLINDYSLGYQWSDILIDIFMNIVLGYFGVTIGSKMAVPFPAKL